MTICCPNQGCAKSLALSDSIKFPLGNRACIMDMCCPQCGKTIILVFMTNNQNEVLVSGVAASSETVNDPLIHGLPDLLFSWLCDVDESIKKTKLESTGTYTASPATGNPSPVRLVEGLLEELRHRPQ